MNQETPTPHTYELKINFAPSSGIKDNVKHWLQTQGVGTFVEGCVEELNLDLAYEDSHLAFDVFDALGGQGMPLSVYKYSYEYLRGLRSSLEEEFGAEIGCEILQHDTKEWQEGWKESLKPVETQKFYVYPPWSKDNVPAEKIGVEIEPGMAFGTGQHQTTVLCLNALAEATKDTTAASPMIDVGTGSGILAIAAKRIGVSEVLGTDIDPDAITSAKANAERNHVSIDVWQGSVPHGCEEKFKLVVANILAPILKKILPDLIRITAHKGEIILSGILYAEKDELVEQGLMAGLVLKSCQRLDDWAVLHFIHIKHA